jgi:hypothetical protein
MGSKEDFLKIMQEQAGKGKAPKKPITRELPEPKMELPQTPIQMSGAASEPKALQRMHFLKRYLPSKRKIVRWAAIVSAAVVLGIGATVWYGINSKSTAKLERDKRIQAIVGKFGQCRDLSSMKQMCMDSKSIELKKNSAKMYAEGEEFVKAGKRYAHLGMTSEAALMIKKCQDAGNVAGAQAIKEEMQLVMEARKQAVAVFEKREMEEIEESKKRTIKDTAALLAKLNKCADPKRIQRMCISDEQEKIRKQSAGSLDKLGEFEKAGIVYAQIGLLQEANTMAVRCKTKGNKRGAARIRDQIKISAEALSKVPDKAAVEKRKSEDEQMKKMQKLQEELDQLKVKYELLINALNER